MQDLPDTLGNLGILLIFGSERDGTGHLSAINNRINNRDMEANAENKSTAMDWILFLVSTAVVILMLIFMNEWFWVALPFSLTYLVKALCAM